MPTHLMFDNLHCCGEFFFGCVRCFFSFIHSLRGHVVYCNVQKFNFQEWNVCTASHRKQFFFISNAHKDYKINIIKIMKKNDTIIHMAEKKKPIPTTTTTGTTKT